ncbi:hypothetical protein THAOC_20995 [Thalassiosira oceanica]|uniref:Uncharacterized protein n=1 Tax=Thalassiosira oceanica TaxID=159749 RepID=K0SD19_THAOC|nr:hypothetical protein THAOC_20995 [Thalassiosira oceanica]|eukprot:EJK58846.1 hypothetical protein THAOC_20995 [Thalassiosira oceanica]
MQGWFELYSSELRPLIEEKDRLCHAIKRERDETKLEEMRAEKQRQQKVVNIKCAAAKAHWYRDFAESIHDMPMDPKKAWECIKRDLHHSDLDRSCNPITAGVKGRRNDTEPQSPGSDRAAVEAQTEHTSVCVGADSRADTLLALFAVTRRRDDVTLSVEIREEDLTWILQEDAACNYKCALLRRGAAAMMTRAISETNRTTRNWMKRHEAAIAGMAADYEAQQNIIDQERREEEKEEQNAAQDFPAENQAEPVAKKSSDLLTSLNNALRPNTLETGAAVESANSSDSAAASQNVAGSANLAAAASHNQRPPILRPSGIDQPNQQALHSNGGGEVIGGTKFGGLRPNSTSTEKMPIKLLCGGERLHHTEKKPTMSMKMDNGELSSTDEEHIGVFGPHFDRVLNNKKDIDFTVLELIEPRETMFELDDPLTRDEFERAVNKLKAGKASGLNGVPPEAFKAMDEELRTLVFGYCVRFWEGEDFRGWQMSQCVPVPTPTSGEE